MTARSIVWIACLILSLLLSALWARFPELDRDPIQRIALFSCLGLLVVPLVFSFPDLDRRKATWLTLASALALRLTLLPAPVSDDVNRYLWEGQLTRIGENPYAVPANSPLREPYRDAYWEASNHRDRPTAYPPGIQWIFALATAVSYQPASMKALALLGDGITLLLLLRLLRHDGAPVRWAGFYAFNPISLISFAAEAHFDSLMVAAILGAVLAHQRKRGGWSWLLLGLAIQIKIIALLLVPFFARRRNLRHGWILICVLTLP
ncbi:MAG: glycosyltransferase 87 family protein, partial [Verrucomicrobiales bacterium]